MACAECGREAPNVAETVKCSECRSVYHVTCCRIRTVKKLSAMSLAAVSAWRCDKCDRDGASSQSQSDNDEPSVKDMFLAIKREVTESRQASDKCFEKIEKKLEGIQNTMDDAIRRIVVVEEENKNLSKRCDDLGRENVELTRKVTCLEGEIDDLQQYSRVNNVEIRGVPATKGEDVFAVLSSIARALGLVYNRGDISVAHRLPPPRSNKFHASIVVQFISRTVKAQWLEAARSKKIKTTDLAASLNPAPVFISDHLTVKNKTILGSARAMVKNGRLAYAWTKDGKVFVRLTPDSPAVRVHTVADVEYMGATPPTTGGATRDPRHTYAAAAAAAAETARKVTVHTASGPVS